MERRVKASSESTAFLVMLIIGLVLLNVLSVFFYTRVDLTERNLHTLSGGTKRLLSSLEDELTIRAYFSEALPPPFNGHERTVRDLLDEYAAYSRGKLQVEILHPDGNEELEKRAQDDGIAKVPHAALREDEAHEVLGYRGLSFSYRAESKAIPVLSRSADISGLEYDFTTTIRQVIGDRRTIGFVSGHGEPGITPPPPRQNAMMPEQDPGISYLNKLVKNYNLRSVNLKTSVPDPEEFRGLVVVGPTEEVSEADLYVLDQYLMRGGAIAFMLNGTKIEESMTGIAATANVSGFQALIKTYGVEMANDIVMDTRTDQFLVTGQVNTPLGRLPMSMPRPYPPWPHLAAEQIDEENPLLFRLPGVSLLWPSTVRITREASDNEQIEAKVLARTSTSAWSVRDNFQLDPRQEEEEWLEQQKRASVRAENHGFPLIVELSGTFPSHFAEKGRPTPSADDEEIDEEDLEHLTESQAPGRILVVGDSDFLNIQYVGSNRRPRHTPSNLTFMMNTLDWLAEDEDLFEIRAKRLEDPSLPELTDGERNWIKWGNIIAWPLLFIIFGAIRWSVRKNRRAQIERTWKKGGKSS